MAVWRIFTKVNFKQFILKIGLNLNEYFAYAQKQLPMKTDLNFQTTLDSLKKKLNTILLLFTLSIIQVQGQPVNVSVAIVNLWEKETTVKKDTTSFVHTVDISSGKIDTVYSVKRHFEAPNWHPDNYLILNSFGKLYTFDLDTKEMKNLDTGSAIANNNDHGISPDNKWLAISNVDRNDPSPKSYKSAIYIVPIEGGEPRRITSEVMSFWHGWSPDGSTLVYTGERNGNFDIYTISTEGGPETRLTETKGLDDGPEYSPDGKHIFFNSFRTGHMQLWRMDADGSNPEQLTFDDNSNWFPHPSPDGKWIAYIAYTSDQAEGHPFGKEVKLCLMNLETKDIKDLTPVFLGGQGTINVPSWSPDSQKVAFVSYSVN